MNIIRIHNLAKPDMCIPPWKVPNIVRLSPRAASPRRRETGDVPVRWHRREERASSISGGTGSLCEPVPPGVLKCTLAPLYEEGASPLLTQPGHTRPAPGLPEGPFS